MIFLNQIPHVIACLKSPLIFLNFPRKPELFLYLRKPHLRASKWVAPKHPVKSMAQKCVLSCNRHQRTTAFCNFLRDWFKFLDSVYKELSWPGCLYFSSITSTTYSLNTRSSWLPEPFPVYQMTSPGVGTDISWAGTSILPLPCPLLYVPIFFPAHITTVGSLKP